MCVCARAHVCGWMPAGMMYLTATGFDEAVKKDQAKTKELEDKFNEKIVKHSVS